MSNLLITGTSGFLGSILAKHFAQSHNVICVSRKPTIPPNVTSYAADFADTGTYRLLDTHKIDILIHMAATGADNNEKASVFSVQKIKDELNWESRTD
jgi:nucleoside-diphosphate-sugar epimerase